MGGYFEVGAVVIILGLHFGHDGSCCIVKDGKLLAACASERFTRQKKSAGVDDRALDAVLATAGVKLKDVDAVALTDWYEPWAHGLYEVRDNHGARLDCTWDRIWDDEVQEHVIKFRDRGFPAYNVGHQKAHCAAAFYTSPYEEAWCMSMDSSGAKPKNNFMLARGNGNRLDWLDTPCCMVGVMYGHVCDNLAIGGQLFKAGSLMALAAYGEPLPWMVDEIEMQRGRAFYGQTDDYHQWKNDLWYRLSEGRAFTHAESDGPTAQAIAASIQLLFEETVLEAVKLCPDDGCDNLCLAGGSFLNCNANSALAFGSRFQNLHLFPGCGDDGCQIGGALYLAHHIMGEPRHLYTKREIAYLGPAREEIAPDYERVADAIADGKVVAWFQGRSEYGPRALGNRSILADPRSPTMRDRINHQVKNREWYRPLSPSVLAHKSEEWFDFPGQSPYMLFTANCPRAEEIPAVVHVDGSARMQTVTEAMNPHYYRVIQAFEAKTDVPMVLNTSLNVDGEPILETAEDAMRFWERGVVDMMLLDGEVM